MVNRVYGRRSERQLLRSLRRFANHRDDPIHIEDYEDEEDDGADNNNFVGPVPGAVFHEEQLVHANEENEEEDDNDDGEGLEDGNNDVEADNHEGEEAMEEQEEGNNEGEAEEDAYNNVEAENDEGEEVMEDQEERNNDGEENVEEDDQNDGLYDVDVENGEDDSNIEKLDEVMHANEENEIEDSEDETQAAKQKWRQRLMCFEENIQNMISIEIPKRITRSSKRKIKEVQKSKLQRKKLRVNPIISLTPSRRTRSATKSASKGNKQIVLKNSNGSTSKSKKRMIEKRNDPFGLRIRTSPSTMVEAIESLTDDQKETVREIGFGGMLGMRLTNSPTKLGHFLVDNVDDEKLILTIGSREMQLTAELVHEMLGIPHGGKDIDDLEEVNDKEEVVAAWKRQFPGKEISKGEIVQKIKQTTDGLLFKLNFITLFVNCVCRSQKNGNCFKRIVNRITGKVDIANLDWSTYVLNAVRNSKKI